MSTYYNFYCTKCLKYQEGVPLTRQALGCGNAEIIDTFRFVMEHTDTCGEVIEHMYFCEDSNNTYTPDTSEELNEYFPHSDDWDQDSLAAAFKEHLARDN